MVSVDHLTLAEASARLAEVEYELERFVAWQKKLRREDARLKREIAQLPSRKIRTDWIRFEEFTDARSDLRHGVHGRSEGVSRHIEFDILGQPGLIEVKYRIARLTKEAAALRDYKMRWPDETTTHPYRFLGSSGLTFVGDRELAAGDVVQLTRSQAFNLRDRFEPVSVGKSRSAAKEQSEVAATS